MRWSDAIRNTALPVAAIVLALAAAATAAVAADPSATRLFATACADCHEGQCSGRTSFPREPANATVHIRQYAGAVDDALAVQLYAALERMKTECRYAPLPAVDHDGGLDAAALAPLRDPWRGGYFMPLGELAAGRYRLSGRLTGSGRIRIEVIDAHFDPWADACLTPLDGGFDLQFSVDTAQPLFVRLRPRAGQVVTSLRLRTLP